MKDWEKRSIKSLFDYTITGEWGDEPLYKDIVPVLRSTNFNNDGSINYVDVIYRSVNKAKLKPRQISRGDVLIEKSGGSPTQPAGRIVFVDSEFEGTSSNFVQIGKIKESLDKKFIFYLLYYNYRIGKILKYQQQTSGLINFKLEDYSKSEFVNVPVNKSEQTAISSIITCVEDNISITQELIKKYHNVLRGALQDLLTRGIDELGVLRHEQTHSFTIKKGMKVPVDWEMKTLEEIAIKITDGSHYSPVPQEEGFLIGNVKDMMSHGFNVSSCAKISMKDFINLKNQNCSPLIGDVLLSKDGTIGRVIHFEQEEEMVVLSSIAIIRVKAEYDSKFVSYLLKSHLFKKQLYALESGSALKRIILKDIKQLCFPFPKSKVEQINISRRLESIEKQIISSNLELSKLQHIKIGLMQELLTGKVKVPGSVLNKLN